MSGPVVHVVRDYGGLTEPFIEQRIGVGLEGASPQLWFERSRGSIPVTSRRVAVAGMAPGGVGDRLFHRIPQLGPLMAGAYSRAERELSPSLIHAHYATTGFLVGSVTQSPLVVGTYGFDVSTMPQRAFWRQAFRALACRADRVLVEGPHMRDAVAGLGFRLADIRIVPIAVDAPSEMSPRKKAGGEVRLLACGRLVEKKGHELAIRAFAELRRGLPAGSTLEIVGRGPLEKRLRAIVSSLGAGDAVSFTGSLARAEFRQRLAAATLFLAPSVTAANGDSEGGAPTTILDAEAVGTIVVGSGHADIPFLVEDGVTGYLATEGDASSLAATIRRALDGQGAWPQILERARAQVVTRHSPAAVAQCLRSVYSEVVG